MPNLNLTHSGNMNITSAEITSAGTIGIQYTKNSTGSLTGWTVTPELDEVVCGQTYDIYVYPHLSGTVLSENFVVSGVDEAGVRRSDTGVLKQGYDGDYKNYLSTNTSGSRQIPGFPYQSQYYFFTVNSFSLNQDNIHFNITITGGTGNNAVLVIYPNWGFLYPALIWSIPIVAEPETGTVVTSLSIVVDDSITGTSQASATYGPQTAYVELHYYSSDPSIATIDENTGVIDVKQTGSVTFTVVDALSNMSDSKTVSVYYGGGLLKVVYNITDYGDTEVMYKTSNVDYVIFDDGETWTNNTYDGYPLYHSFDSLGLHTAYICTTNGVVPGFNLVSALYSIEMPSGYTLDDDYSVWYSGLRYVTLPSDLETIPNLYFAGTQISGITIPSSVRTIEDGAFQCCPNLTGVTMQEGIVRFGSTGSSVAYMFSECPNLTYVNLPDSIEVLGGAIFNGNTLLTSVHLPSGITALYANTFKDCTGLTEITIPSGVTYIEDNFRGCSGITAMTIEATTAPSHKDETTGHWWQYPLGDNDYTFPFIVPCEAVDDYVVHYQMYYNISRFECIPGPDTGETGGTYTYIDTLAISVNSTILDSGITSVVYTPSGSLVYPVYSSSDPDVISVDPFTGVLTVNEPGDATITARDSYTNITDSTIVTGYKTADLTQYYSKYLTFEIISGGTINWNTAKTIQVRKNGGDWGNMPSSLSVVAGDVLEFKTTSNISRFNGQYFQSSGGCRFNASGNIMSVGWKVFGVGGNIPDNYYFRDFFKGCEGIVDSERLILPSTGLTAYCYYSMFENCVNLTKGPYLPARNLYSAGTSYTGASSCYAYMFSGCSSLSYLKCMVERTVYSNQTSGWLSGVAQDGLFIKSKNVTFGAGPLHSASLHLSLS